MDLINTINPAELMQKFGDNKIEAAKYISRTHNVKLKEAKSIVESLYYQNRDLLPDIWAPTKTIGTYFQIDDNNKKWAPLVGIFKPQVAGIYSYSDILEYELLEDGDSITKGGLGRAVIGGALFGGVGAIVGSVTGGKKQKKIVTSMSIKITTKNIDTPAVYINFITGKTKTNSLTYKAAVNCAQEVMSVLAQIIAQNENTQSNPPESHPDKIDPANEIRKYKQLLDDGIITQDEFESKKKQLLNL